MRFKRRSGFAAAIVALCIGVPLAVAAPGDPDPDFGNNGVFELPSGDRYQAVDAPLVQSSGRIIFAGLLRNASDRVFLAASTPNGTLDTSFGTAGEVHTNSIAASRMAATALAPDGKVLVAGGASAEGRITIERFTADGARDGSWGSSGRITVNLGSAYARPTGMAVAGPDSVFVTVESPSGNRNVFTVVKVGSSGPDSSFGTQGIARVAFPSNRAATAYDLVVLPSGKLLLAGSSKPPGSAGADTGLARLNANGTLDTGFGSGGLATHNITGDTSEDYAAALKSLADGRFVVTGPAAGNGMVARFNENGSLDTSFGTAGKVVGGLMAAGAGFVPADVGIDPAGRPIVTGSQTSGSPTSYRWGVVRLTHDASSPVLDGFFGDGGRVVLEECANTGGAGPTGATLDGARILILGACEETARTALVRLQGGGGPPAGPITLSVDPAGEAAGHERIPLAGLDPSAAVDAAEDAQAAALRRTALRRTALRRTDIASTALRRTALRRTGLLSTALRRTALRRTLLSEIALRRTTWQELLGTDAPLQGLTLEDAYNINPDAVGALTLDDIDLNSTALRRTSLAALVLGVRPLDALPAPDGGWCAFLADQPFNCSNGVATGETTLVELELLGDDLAAYYENPISLRQTDLGTGEGAAPIADFLLSELDLSIAPFRDVEASEFAPILNCGGCEGRKLSDLSDAELGNATVAQLVGLLPQPSLADVSVGDVLLAMLDHSEIPYEALDLEGLLGEAEHRSADLMIYDARFALDCSQAADLKAIFHAPGDARPVPGGTTVALGAGPSRDIGDGKPAEGTKKGPFTFDLAPACEGATGTSQATMTMKVEPGSVLGPIDGAALSVRGSDPDLAVKSNEVTTTVDDSRDPGDEIGQSRALGEDALLTGHLASATDSDLFAFTPGTGRSTVSLSHLPDDYDLVIYGPDVGPDETALRRTALRRTALRRTPVDDAAEAPLDEAILEPDQVQDIALRRTELAVRASSINRGTNDEAASVVVGPEEAGETFVAQVVGYNGAADASPYVIRRTDAPAAEPLSCPARPLSSGFQIPYPEQIPNATKAIYLVDPGRMAARDGQAQAESALTKLDELAAETNGVVIPVQGNPRVATTPAFTAFDQDPCSPELANAVVTKINEVVDDVREQGGGLPELRSIVVIGPDEVIPQARIPDNTVIGNESDYADDAALDRNGDGVPDDSAVSAAFRQGYMLSDDPYGDFDPSENGFVPDVALGRLVETPQQIEAQVQSFLDSDGVVEPQRSFVTGYDFLSDGAAEIFSSLEGAVPDGASQSRIDETWTAQDGLDGLNAAGPGLLSLNAHYDHYRALPAAAFNGTSPNLLPAAQASPPPGSVAFTLGCHSGLNVAVGDASSASDPRLGDWAERMVTQGALYTANTGYGYGDDTAVAYSERIMADYASRLVSGEVTAGQALMLAKQATDAQVGVGDVYWGKASMEATFYGLPMYRFGADGGEGDSVLPPSLTGDDPTDPTTRSSTPFSTDLRDDLTQVDDERGTYWKVGDQEPLVVQRRPIQPKLTEDVTSEEGPAHGFLLESLTTTDLTGADPAIARATIDLAAHEPEPEATEPFFPATVATVEPQATADGRRDILSLMAGSFRDDVQRLNLEMGGRVLRSSSDDFSPPVIRRVDGLVAGGGFSIRVEVGGNDILGGTVMYVTDADQAGGGEVEWHRSDLSQIAPGVLSTGGPLPSGATIPEAIVQVYDRSYNVAYSDRKVEGHTFSPLQEPGTGDPRITFTPGVPPSGYYSAPPEISIDPGEHDDATFEVSVDGGEFRRFDGPFTIGEPAEGEHLVVIRGSDGSGAAARFAVDREGPSIVAEADRPAGAGGWYDGPVTFSFTCGDAVAGVADCPEPVTFSDAGANSAVTVAATDRAGNSSSLSVGPVNIDLADPTISAQTLTAPNEFGWYNAAGVTVRFSCEDDVGLTHCGDDDLTGTPKSATDEVVFTEEGRDQRVTGTAIDQAGRTATAQSPPVNIDRTKPDVAITTPSGSVLVGSNARLRGTAFDELSGVRTVEITYTKQVGSQRRVREATLNCPDGTGACTWEANLPSIGFWQASARATDFAGNVSPETAKTLITVK